MRTTATPDLPAGVAKAKMVSLPLMRTSYNAAATFVGERSKSVVVLDKSKHGKPMGGEGTVDFTFRLSGRGFVVVLEEAFSGTVRVGQVLESPAGRTLINAVEQGHGREAAEVKAFVGLIVEDAAAPLFAKGQRVKFYEPA